MTMVFEKEGIRFQYPEEWQLETQESDSGWTVSVQSPDTAFWLLSFDGDMPETDQVAETALEALRQEYPDLEAEPCVDSMAGQMAFGHEIRFFSMDLTNTCWTRSFYSGNGTILVMWQANDLELEKNEGILKAISASLKVEED